MSGRLQQRREDGSAGKRRSDGGGWPLHLLLCLGALLVLTPWPIVAASSDVSLRSAPSPTPKEGTVPAPEGADRPGLDVQLDDAMEEIKTMLRKSPKMLNKLNTVLKTRMDLENQIVRRVMSSGNIDPAVDEEKVTETAELVREKLLNRPAVGFKFVGFLHGRQPTTLEGIEDFIRNIDLSPAAPAAISTEGQEAAPIKEEAKTD